MSIFNKHKITSLLLLNFLIFLLLFIVLEIITRIAFTAHIPFGNETRKFWQYDSLLGWSHIPLVTGKQTTAGASVEIQINSKKLRDDEYSYTRTSKRRILVLGDSYAWGYGVNKNERFSEVLETKNKNVEVINAGVAGYSSDQQLLYYTSKGYKYNPDYVLLLFYENDFLGNTLSQIHWYNKPFFVPENNVLTLKSVPVPQPTFYQKLRKFLSGSSHFISFVLKRLTILNVKSYSMEDFSFSDAAILTGKIIEKLNSACKDNNARLLLAAIPMSPDKINFLSNLADKYSYDFLDLTPFFKNKKDYILPDGVHWNSKGHAIAGEAIFEWFRQLEIIK